MVNRVRLISKNGNWNLYLTGRVITTTQTKGVVQKSDDGDYYEVTNEVIDGVPTMVMSDSLGTSV